MIKEKTTCPSIYAISRANRSACSVRQIRLMLTDSELIPIKNYLRKDNEMKIENCEPKHLKGKTFVHVQGLRLGPLCKAFQKLFMGNDNQGGAY